jgi:hypothetical protein
MSQFSTTYRDLFNYLKKANVKQVSLSFKVKPVLCNLLREH